MNEIKTESDRTYFIWTQVEWFLEDVEKISPEDATDEYKRDIFKFFDRMVKEYKIREGK